MTQPISVTDELLAAARMVTTTFAAVPSEPVPVCNAGAMTPVESAEVVGRYLRNGFAVLRLETDAPTPDALTAIASSLDLGEMFVPPLYNSDGKKGATVHRISAAVNAGTADANHPSFGRTVGQPFHVDGTLQPVGYLKASLLVCENPAADGGDTTLFNTSGAIAQLAAVDEAAVRALATHGTLVRRANINGCDDANLGSVCTVQDGGLVCWYCVTDTDSFAVPDGASEVDVHRGIGFLLHAAAPGSAHHLQFRLRAGEAIIFDNTRISHGRTPYRDSAESRRCLYRSLHLRHPRVTARSASRLCS